MQIRADINVLEVVVLLKPHSDEFFSKPCMYCTGALCLESRVEGAAAQDWVTGWRRQKGRMRDACSGVVYPDPLNPNPYNLYTPI